MGLKSLVKIVLSSFEILYLNYKCLVVPTLDQEPLGQWLYCEVLVLHSACFHQPFFRLLIGEMDVRMHSLHTAQFSHIAG